MEPRLYRSAPSYIHMYVYTYVCVCYIICMNIRIYIGFLVCLQDFMTIPSPSAQLSRVLGYIFNMFFLVYSGGRHYFPNEYRHKCWNIILFIFFCCYSGRMCDFPGEQFRAWLRLIPFICLLSSLRPLARTHGEYCQQLWNIIAFFIFVVFMAAAGASLPMNVGKTQWQLILVALSLFL